MNDIRDVRDPDLARRRADDDRHAAWNTATTVVLKAIAESRFANSLVLRGSMLLRSWYGREAREPGDLDFVVVPPTWRIDDPATTDLLDAVARAAEATSAGTGVHIDASRATVEGLWAYDRAPGRRLFLPWYANGRRGGAIQLDFVFREYLPTDPQYTTVRPTADAGPAEAQASGSDAGAAPEADPTGPGAGVRMLAATAEQSLAWKLSWLLTDPRPKIKDLVDAVLLAERTSLRYDVFRDSFLIADQAYLCRPPRSQDLHDLLLDWEDFERDVDDDIDGWDLNDRLTAATAPLLDELDAGGDDYLRYERWLRPVIERCRRLAGDGRAAADGLAAVHQDMIHGGIRPQAAIVIVRELSGRDSMSVVEAYQRIVAEPAWAMTLAMGNHYVELLPYLVAFGADGYEVQVPPPPTPRLNARIAADFARTSWRSVAQRTLTNLPVGADEVLATERARAAVVLAAHGDFDQFARMAQLARTDLPAVFAASGLDGADWAEQMDAQLGT